MHTPYPTEISGPDASGESLLALDLFSGSAAVSGDDSETTIIETRDWSPPPLAVPLALHPYDHYWFHRPVTSDYVNEGLDWYPYGSNGPADDLQIHHGTDIANPVGVAVHAVADGTVIWAGRGHINEYEAITAYGNTIVIAHDFGYEGNALYTLYAHLSEIQVNVDERVAAGQVIGLIGATGQVTGPHVHFEVRIGRNSYFAVRNPDLWLAPYSGTGVIAGRVAFESGALAEDASVIVRSAETGRVVYQTSTYAGFGVNPDDLWKENFVIPNVPVGIYDVSAHSRSSSWAGQVEVHEGMTNWVFLATSDGS